MKEQATTNRRKNLNAKDLITIGVFAAMFLVIFFVVGSLASLTIVGTIANIPITALFTAVVYMLVAAKVQKRGVFFILGIVNALPGFMAANVLGVIASIAGWFIAELIANSHHYSKKRDLILAYVTGSTLHFLGFSLPMYISNVEYMTSRQEILHLTDAALQEYLQYFTWPVYAGMAVLTIVTSFLGARIGVKILKKHFQKAGLIG